jgi:thymidylate synthase
MMADRRGRMWRNRLERVNLCDIDSAAAAIRRAAWEKPSRMNAAFEPLYYGERLRVLNPGGDVGFVTFWSPIVKAVEKLAEIDPDLAGSDSRVAVVGHLYGDGLYAMLCNLLNNPQIRHLVSAGQDLSGCAAEIEAFLTRGTEAVEMLGKPMRRIIGTTRFLPALADFDEAALRARLSYRHFGQFSAPDLVAALGAHLADLPRHTGDAEQRTVVAIPAPGEGDFSFRPSDPGGHQVLRRRPLEAWRELVVRVLRFGRPVTLHKGTRLELLNAKVVIAEPAEETAEQLAVYGFNLERFHAYQQKILDGALPEGISYTYGNRLRAYFGDAQAPTDTIAAAIAKLKQNPETRHAYISLWDTARDLTSAQASDTSTPCLTTLFFRRSQGKLALFATYRAHNLLTAWLENVYGLMAIQKFVAAAVGMEIGPMTVISQSLGADPASSRFAIGESVRAAWDRDDDLDPATGKPVLREDPNGYFAFSIDEAKGAVIADHLFEGVLIKRYEAAKAEAIEAAVSADMAISLVSHALWFGRELARHEAKLKASQRGAAAKPAS